mmetsp:Transcript_22459/g.64558  ORF Transcript_22459/g.64558 Transcript_22459/m.64558 type:complete len:217 (-) Transcript_22459:1332-1982(-)
MSTWLPQAVLERIRCTSSGSRLARYSGGLNWPISGSHESTAFCQRCGKPLAPIAAPRSPPTAAAFVQQSPPPANIRRMASSKPTDWYNKRKACFKGISTEPTSPSSKASCAKLEKTSSPSPARAFCNQSPTTSKATTCCPGGVHDALSAFASEAPSGRPPVAKWVQPLGPPPVANCCCSAPPERTAFASLRVQPCKASRAPRRSPSKEMRFAMVVA